MAESYCYFCWMVLGLLSLSPYPRLFVLSSFSPEQAVDIRSLDKVGSPALQPGSESSCCSAPRQRLSSERIPLIVTVKSLCLWRRGASWLERGMGVEHRNSESLIIHLAALLQSSSISATFSPSVITDICLCRKLISSARSLV